MNFAFSSEQSELHQRVRRLAEEKIAPIAAEADESPTVHAGLMAILAASGLLLYSEVRALNIYEGTSEVQRQTIARQ